MYRRLKIKFAHCVNIRDYSNYLCQPVKVQQRPFNRRYFVTFERSPEPLYDVCRRPFRDSQQQIVSTF